MLVQLMLHCSHLTFIRGGLNFTGMEKIGWIEIDKNFFHSVE